MLISRRVFSLCVPIMLAATPVHASLDKPESVTVPPPPLGKAQVVFFRAGGYEGSAISCAVKEGDTKLGSLPPGRFIIIVAEPGKHTYATTSSSTDGIYLTLKEGDVQYARCTIKTGFWVGKASLDIAKDEEFTTKLWKSVDPARVSPVVLTDEQIRVANAAHANSSPALSNAPNTPPASTVPATPGVAESTAPQP